jgi:hypothetical protein
MAAVLAGLLLVGLVGAGLALSGALPLIGAEPSPRVTASPTAQPTPDWRTPLLAGYLDACGESLDRSELRGMTLAQASSWVDEQIAKCRDEGGGRGKDKGKGHGNGDDGHGGD